MPSQERTSKPVALTRQRAELPAPPDFVKAEKNLLSLGLFTPSSNELRNAKSKTIGFVRVDGDQRIEASVTIAASAIHGLPDTADQDKYLALQKIITERRRLEGHIANPLMFTTAELLKTLGRAKGGKRYEDVAEFLQRMTLTGIVSRRAVFLADRRTWATETFHVFEKVVSVGESLPDGSVAQMNYVWLSEWQINNINSNFTLPIDIEVYRRLKSHIAKGLVPHLQIWLYTSRSDGRFVKRYDHLCQLLGLRPQKHASRIRQQLGPSLDELKEHDYIASWSLAETRDGHGFKVELYHGVKFHRDLRLRQGEKLPDESQLNLAEAGDDDGEEPGPDLMGELTRRGITAKIAMQILERAHDGRVILDQLEWADHLVAATPDRFYNPAGFYVSVLRDNVPVPSSFETSRMRMAREAARRESTRRDEQLEASRLAYAQYCDAQVDHHIETTLTAEAFERLVEDKKKRLLDDKRFKFSEWNPGQFHQYATMTVRREVSRDVIVPSFQEYQDAISGGSLS
jgi:hypothetical protein